MPDATRPGEAVPATAMPDATRPGEAVPATAMRVAAWQCRPGSFDVLGNLRRLG
jgi:hypothetical protein